MSQEWPKNKKSDHLSDLAGNIIERKESKDLDLSNKEVIIHGTFIENLESILRNGFNDSLAKRHYDGYGKTYPKNLGGRLPWEQPFGKGLFFERINGKTAINLNLYNQNLQNLFDILENWKLIKVNKNSDEIEGKNLKLYSREIRKAIKNYIQAWKDGKKDGSVRFRRKLTLFDLVDENGNPKDCYFRDSKNKIGKFFYDKDGWLRVWRDIEFHNKKFEWGQGFTDNYPIHLVMDPKYFSEGKRPAENYPGYSEYYRSFEYAGKSIPPEAIKGVIISFDTNKRSLTGSEDFPDLTRRSYIPERNKETKEPKEIKREVLIRFLSQLLGKIKRDRPDFEMPVYDEKGGIIFSI